MLRRLAHVLSEPAMGFLALAALVFGVVPELFDVSPLLQALLALAEWIVVALFAFEYATHLALAPDKRAYVLDPWRLLDLVIILAPFASLVPGAPEFMRSAPFLRVLRLVRALVAGSRAGARLRQRGLEALPPAPQGPPVVTRLEPDAAVATALDWPALQRWLAAPRGWLHASSLEPARIDELARDTGVPRALIDAALGAASFPRLETYGAWAALALALPAEEGRREPLLLLMRGEGVLSLSLFRSELQDRARPLPGATPVWPLRVALGVVRLVLHRHEEAAGRIERALRALEDLPAEESSGEFFSQAFVLRKRLTAAKADLWRLRGILRSVADGRRTLPGLEPADREGLTGIAEEADALHETAEALRESLLSLLDLHLNVSGFGMNRFMRLLAIVSALALIPTIVGGLMGMNLVGNPWPVTLSQVAFGTFVLMLCVLYAFLAKGWLR